MSIIEQREDELISAFDLLDDALLQYEYVLAFTDELEQLPPEECTDQTKVEGCASSAWLALCATDGGCLRIRAHSEALIVRGLLGIMSALTRNASCADIAAWQPRFTDAPGIAAQLSANRRSGLAAMLALIQNFARKVSASDE